MSKDYYIGVDIGGTKIHLGLLDKKINIISDKKIISSYPGEVRKDFLNLVKYLSTFLKENHINIQDIEFIGICTPS